MAPAAQHVGGRVARLHLQGGAVVLLLLALPACDHRGGSGTVPDDGSVVIPISTSGGDGGSDGGWFGDPGSGQDADCGCDGTADGTDAGDASGVGADGGGMDGGDGGAGGGDGGGGDGGGGGELVAPPRGGDAPPGLPGRALQASSIAAPGPEALGTCVHGVVSDGQDRRIAGATVTTALDGATGVTVTTGRAGQFCLSGLPANGTTLAITTAAGATFTPSFDASSWPAGARSADGCIQLRAVIPAER